MAVKKKAVKQVGKQIECPQHPDKMLDVQIEGNRKFAICNCPVRSNMWKGRVVWEQIGAEKNAEEKPAGGFFGSGSGPGSQSSSGG